MHFEIQDLITETGNSEISSFDPHKMSPNLGDESKVVSFPELSALTGISSFDPKKIGPAQDESQLGKMTPLYLD